MRPHRDWSLIPMMVAIEHHIENLPVQSLSSSIRVKLAPHIHGALQKNSSSGCEGQCHRSAGTPVDSIKHVSNLLVDQVFGYDR